MATPIANIPEISASQNGKFLTHNEALRHIEAISIGAVEGILSTPPSSTSEGLTYIVGNGATGAWAGQTHKIAQRLNNSWYFYPVVEGFTIASKFAEGLLYFTGTSWVSLSSGGGGSGTSLITSNGLLTVNPTTLINFQGGTFTDDGNGEVTVTIPSTSSSSSLTVGNTSNVDNIQFTGATVTNNGNGDVTVAITGGGSGGGTTSLEVNGIPNIDNIVFSNSTVSNLGNGNISVTVPSGSGGNALDITQGTTTAVDVTTLNVTGSATLTSQGNGVATLSVAPSSLRVTDNSTTVDSATQLIFNGATVNNNGSGSATINLSSLGSNLTVRNGAGTTIPTVDTITFPSSTITNQGNGDITVTIPSQPVLTVQDSSSVFTEIGFLEFLNGTVSQPSQGRARVTFNATTVLAFSSVKQITLPYTLQLIDLGLELIVTNQTGNFFIPNSLAFPIGGRAMLSLDGSGTITILNSNNTTNNLVLSGGNNKLKTQGSVELIARNATTFKVVGFLEP